MKQRLKFEKFSAFVGKPITELYEHLKKNYAGQLAKKSDVNEGDILKDGNWYYFFDSVYGLGGNSFVPAVIWYGGELYRFAYWLESVWHSHDRVVLLETEDGEFPKGVNNWKQNLKKVEYKVIQVQAGENKDNLEGFLDSWGQEGWELCHWERYIDASVYVFKRTKKELNK